MKRVLMVLLLCGIAWPVFAEEAFSVRYFNTPADRPPGPEEYRVPEEEDEAFLDGVLQEIFPEGMAGLSEEAKAIEIMRYVSSALELKNNGGSATKVLREGYAICGGMSHAFRVLCRKAGIPSRYIGAFYLRPVQGGHAISEVYYGGKWRLLDPTFAMFYYSKNGYDGTGEIASFHDVVLNPDGWTAMKVVEKPWGGMYDASIRAFGVAPAGPDYLKDVYGTSIVELYHKYATETFPVAYGSDDPVSFPVDVDLREAAVFEVGKVDGDSRDVVLAALNGTTYVGGHYVGGSFPPGFHTWSLQTPGRCRVRVTYSSTAENPPALRFVPLKAVRLAEFRSEGKQSVFELLVIGPEAIFSIYSPERTFVVDAIEAMRSAQ